MQKKEKSGALVLIEYGLFASLIRLANLLPLSVAFVVSKLIFKALYILVPKYRNRVIKHMSLAGIATADNDKEMAWKHYEFLSRFFVDVMRGRRGDTFEQAMKDLKISGSEAGIEYLVKSDKPVIMLTGHYGLWEFLGAVACYFSKRKMLTPVRFFDNPRLGAFFNDIRNGYGHEVCDKLGATRDLLKTLKRGGSIAMLVDQHAARKEGVSTTFFGLEASTHSSAARLHLRLKIPIVVAMLRRLPGEFQYEWVISDPIMPEGDSGSEEDIQKVAQQYTSDIEAIISECPEQWLWGARRWRNLPED